MDDSMHYKLLEIAEDTHNLIQPVCSREISELMKMYNLTNDEAVVFTFLLKFSFDNSYLNLEKFESEEIKKGDKNYIRILKNLKFLEKKNMLLLNSENSRRRGDALNPTIQIDEAVLTKIVLNEDIYDDIDFSDIYSVIECADNIIDRRQHTKISESRFFSDFEYFVTRIDKSLDLKQIILKYTTTEQAMIMRACLNKVTGDDPDTCIQFVNHIFETIRNSANMMQRIFKNQQPVFKDKVLKIDENGGFMNSPTFELSDKYYEKIFQSRQKKEKRELRTVLTEHIEYKNLNKELYFDESLQKQVGKISDALSDKRFRTVTKQLKDSGYAPGIVSLLYGYPGTGKTATVHEIARITKRDILQVDISNIKDKWVGESEKRLKEVFNEYRKAVKILPRTPILLFNEADALIGKRIDVERSVDSMYNSMQNIILEELEKFDGIFFATTNLTQNMDDAFSRRFLYKIEFTKPSPETRKKIWTSKMKDIPEKWIDKLSVFELSGGQIDNIARKFIIDSILEDASDYEELEQMCIIETSFKNESAKRTIGFAE